MLKKLIQIYIFIFPFNYLFTMLHLCPSFEQLGISDYLFIPILLVWLWSLVTGEVKFKLSAVGLCVILYIIFVSLSLINSNDIKHSLIVLFKIAYLAALFFVIQSAMTQKDIHALLIPWGLALSMILLFGLIGLVLYLLFHTQTPFILFNPYFPVMGPTVRIISIFLNPNMLMSYLIVSAGFLFYFFVVTVSNKYKILVGLLLLSLLVVSIFTFSGGIVGFFAALFLFLVLINKIRPYNKLANFAITVIFICLMGISVIDIFFEHVHISPVKISSYFDRNTSLESLHDFGYFDKNIGLRHAVIDFGISKKPRLIEKEVALRIFRNHPLIGAGIGTFNTIESAYRKIGAIPQDFPAYDPHCFITGALAETGLFGFLSLLLLLCYVTVTTILSLKPGIPTNIYILKAGCISALIGLLLQGINMDIMHLRHLWILMAFLAILNQEEKLVRKVQATKVSS